MLVVVIVLISAFLLVRVVQIINIVQFHLNVYNAKSKIVKLQIVNASLLIVKNIILIMIKHHVINPKRALMGYVLQKYIVMFVNKNLSVRIKQITW